MVVFFFHFYFFFYEVTHFQSEHRCYFIRSKKKEVKDIAVSEVGLSQRLRIALNLNVRLQCRCARVCGECVRARAGGRGSGGRLLISMFKVTSDVNVLSHSLWVNC